VRVNLHVPLCLDLHQYSTSLRFDPGVSPTCPNFMPACLPWPAEHLPNAAFVLLMVPARYCREGRSPRRNNESYSPHVIRCHPRLTFSEQDDAMSASVSRKESQGLRRQQSASTSYWEDASVSE